MINRYKILIVDDIAENIQTLTKCYEELHPGYILYQATSGQTAMELAAAAEVDIIISDWEMPGMSGIELVEALKLKLLENLLGNQAEARSLIVELLRDIENNASETNWNYLDKLFRTCIRNSVKE